MFGTAVAVEGLAKFRHVTVARVQQRNHKTAARYAIPLLHGLQAAAGYILMLLAMTFSMEVLCSVVAGLAAGYGLFFQLPDNNSNGEDVDPYRLRQHVTTNPCCEFMEEESKETTTAATTTIASSRGVRRTGAAAHGEEDLTLILEGEEDTPPTSNIRNARNSNTTV